MHPAAAVTRRLQDDPDQIGQESQSCSQKEVEEGWAEQGGRGPAAGGHTVEERWRCYCLVWMLSCGARRSTFGQQVELN